MSTSWISRRAPPLPAYFEPIEAAVDAIHRAGLSVDEVFSDSCHLIVRSRDKVVGFGVTEKAKRVASGVRITGHHVALMQRLVAAAPPDTHVGQLLLEGRIDIELVAA